MNAAVLATDGATVTITNSYITSSVQGGNGVFSYGTGTTVYISDCVIVTTADNSGGIQTTGGGTTYATNLTITTSGNSSAAIRSDRGGGTVVVDGGTYTSKGWNSPAVYSTADITVSNATLIAENSEALVIEGKNSITLIDCDTTGTKTATQSSSKNLDTIMIYQSMSGDADVGTSVLTIQGGTLTGNAGDLIFVTNTDAVISLSGCVITNNGDGLLLNIRGNNADNSNGSGWGTAGANGGNVTMTTEDQVLEGDVEVDTISTLAWTMKSGTEFTGTINIVANADNGTAVSNNAVIVVEEGAVWTLTGNCTITSLTNNGTINYNGYTITLADGTVLGG